MNVKFNHLNVGTLDECVQIEGYPGFFKMLWDLSRSECAELADHYLFHHGDVAEFSPQSVVKDIMAIPVEFNKKAQLAAYMGYYMADTNRPIRSFIFVMVVINELRSKVIESMYKSVIDEDDEYILLQMACTSGGVTYVFNNMKNIIREVHESPKKINESLEEIFKDGSIGVKIATVKTGSGADSQADPKVDPDAADMFKEVLKPKKSSKKTDSFKSNQIILDE